MRFSQEFWRPRPDLNRGLRSCRQGRDVYLVDSSCFLVGPTPSFSLVFGRYCSHVVRDFPSRSFVGLLEGNEGRIESGTGSNRSPLGWSRALAARARDIAASPCRGDSPDVHRWRRAHNRDKGARRFR
jgi:hypothetical protein